MSTEDFIEISYISSAIRLDMGQKEIEEVCKKAKEIKNKFKDENKL